ncbi:MAG: tRNA dihydrouridine synthase DusB [Solobacterium sp.]|nr:tRNA dihydrouridine synthase DusB [Solobacterium sp.]
MFAIGGVKLSNRIIAAPLAGYSNPVYRRQCMQYGAGLTVSEMISDKALHYKNSKTQDMCRVFEDEHPVALQLFGSDPDTLAEAAEYLSKNTTCDIIDINMGCPVPKVLRSNAGSWLMHHPEAAYNAVKAVKEHTDRPVTVKIRAGWSAEEINCVEIARLCEEAGASAIAVHGRTRTQMYEGKANPEYIRMVKEAVSVPVIANGDIRTVQDADRMLEITKADAIMIGRGLLGRPFFLQELNAHFRGTDYTPPSYEERLEIMKDYARQLCDYEGEMIGIRQMRSMAGWYIAGMPYAAACRGKLAQMRTLQDLYDITDAYVKELRREDDNG